MVSGFFDPFHQGSLSYLKQAKALVQAEDNFLICIVGSDAQLLLKKDRVNIPEAGRLEIVDMILRGLGMFPFCCELNRWDTDTILVAKALEARRPELFFRGGDKALNTMARAELWACYRLGIVIKHATLEHDTHGAGMLL